MSDQVLTPDFFLKITDNHLEICIPFLRSKNSVRMDLLDRIIINISIVDLFNNPDQ